MLEAVRPPPRRSSLPSAWARARPWVALATAAALSASCYPERVELNAPGPAASFEERHRAYRELRPEPGGEHLVVDAWGAGAARRWTYLALRGDDKVYHADDILPVVPRDSAAASSARSSAALARRSRFAELAAVGLGLASPLVVFYGIHARDAVDLVPIAGVGFGFLVGGGISYGFSRHWHKRADRRRVRAYNEYHGALLERLALCEEGGRLVDCPRRSE